MVRSLSTLGQYVFAASLTAGGVGILLWNEVSPVLVGSLCFAAGLVVLPGTRKVGARVLVALLRALVKDDRSEPPGLPPPSG